MSAAVGLQYPLRYLNDRALHRFAHGALKMPHGRHYIEDIAANRVRATFHLRDSYEALMLYLSEILIQNPQLDSFDELLEVVRQRAKGEMFFRIDIKPTYDDTPENWEDRLEAAFTS